MPPTFSEIAEQAQQLDTDSKQDLLDLLRAWLVEERRAEIARNAQEAEHDLATGNTKTGTVDDLMADLYAQD